MQLKGGEFNLIEAQGFGAIRQDVLKVGTGPVEDRHKVVAHGANTALGQIAQALLIVSDPLRVVDGMSFDLFVNWYAFDHRPYQAGFFHDGLTLEDLVNRPHFAVRDMVQGGDHSGRARLTDVS